MKRVFALLVLVMMLVRIGAAAEIDFPLQWRTPAGWKAETFLLPAEFAKDLEFRGVEALRFAPGFGDPKSPEYFTYVFAWLIDDKPAVVDWRMPQYLRRYYGGLMAQEARERKLTIGGTKAAFSTETAATPVVFVETWDALITGKPLQLYVRVSSLETSAPGKRLLYFEASPRPSDPTVQRDFATIRAQLQP